MPKGSVRTEGKRRKSGAAAISQASRVGKLQGGREDLSERWKEN